MTKFLVRKFYQQPDGSYTVEAANEYEARDIAITLTSDDGLDPDEYEYDVERIAEGEADDQYSQE